MEKVFEKLPKVECRFDGCRFKKTNGELLKKHENDCCEYRYVPCGYCDAKIGLHSIADHLIDTHSRSPGVLHGFSDSLSWRSRPFAQTLLKKDQSVIRVIVNDNTTSFLVNMSFDELTTMLWVSFVGPKESAKNFKYTFKLEETEEDVNGRAVYSFSGTRFCVPCDLSHEDVKNSRRFLMMDKGLFEDAQKDEKGRVKISVSIHRA